MGGGARIVITQAPNSTKGIKIQPKPEPGISQTLPVVTVPKINKGEFSGGEICVFKDHKCTLQTFYWSSMAAKPEIFVRTEE